MEKTYVVMYTIDDDGDFSAGIFKDKAFETIEEARDAMIDCFYAHKAEFDNTDDLDETHRLNSAYLQANNEWVLNLQVVELHK